jgi:hypothetical protein
MSRIVTTGGSPASQRNALRRTIAEVLRRLAAKREVDAETRDMLACIVLALRGINDNIDQSASAWEKRDYYLKADQFRREWRWVPGTADRLQAVLLAERWAELPAALAELAPRFADVRVVQFTKPASNWEGAYERLTRNGAGRR